LDVDEITSKAKTKALAMNRSKTVVKHDLSIINPPLGVAVPKRMTCFVTDTKYK
jgi:hypothetical protein